MAVSGVQQQGKGIDTLDPGEPRIALRQGRRQVDECPQFGRPALLPCRHRVEYPVSLSLRCSSGKVAPSRQTAHHHGSVTDREANRVIGDQPSPCPDQLFEDSRFSGTRCAPQRHRLRPAGQNHRPGMQDRSLADPQHCGQGRCNQQPAHEVIADTGPGLHDDATVAMTREPGNFGIGKIECPVKIPLHAAGRCPLRNFHRARDDRDVRPKPRAIAGIGTGHRTGKRKPGNDRSVEGRQTMHVGNRFHSVQRGWMSKARQVLRPPSKCGNVR